MSAQDFDQLAQTNPEFKRLVWQAILVRSYAPISTVTIQLKRLRMDVNGARDMRHITDLMHDYIIAVLDGRLFPTDE